jgi:hypothetical protein
MSRETRTDKARGNSDGRFQTKIYTCIEVRKPSLIKRFLRSWREAALAEEAQELRCRLQ